jgi:ferrous iron transport protein A
MGDNKMKTAKQEAPPESLSVVPAGRRGQVHALAGGHEFRSRAANLGFTAGAQVLVKQNFGHGPMLVLVRGALIALGRAEAANVLVQVTE